MSVLKPLPWITTAAALGLSACGTPLQVDASRLAGTEWILTGFQATHGSAVELLRSAPVTLRFLAEGQVRGGTGCHALEGVYRIRGSRIRLDDLSLLPVPTDCGAHGEMESTYLAALDAVHGYEQRGADQLDLHLRFGLSGVLTFRRLFTAL
jgi:hypothetical protein